MELLEPRVRLRTLANRNCGGRRWHLLDLAHVPVCFSRILANALKALGVTTENPHRADGHHDSETHGLSVGTVREAHERWSLRGDPACPRWCGELSTPPESGPIGRHVSTSCGVVQQVGNPREFREGLGGHPGILARVRSCQSFSIGTQSLADVSSLSSRLTYETVSARTSTLQAFSTPATDSV